MKRNNFVRLTGAQKSLLALLASGAFFTSGCSNLTPTALSNANAASTSADSIGGKVHGGAQPVVGATVTLYAAGQNAAATQLATTTSASDGTFSFSKSGTGSNGYTCPSTTDPLVYVMAKGGNTVNDGNSAHVNNAAAFLGVYGVCSAISSANYITLNEATTVATMLAVQQYFNPATEGLTSNGSGTSKTAIDNTLNTISLLVNPATGVALASSTIAGSGGLSTVSVTATPEQQKLNLLSNIITACVNNTSASAPNCQTLISSAPAPLPQVTNNPSVTFPVAGDVLQALYYMLTNPTSGSLANRTALFNLASGAGAPFEPALATQPADWTVAVSYSSNSTCGTATAGVSPALLSAPDNLAIDQSGSVWVANATGNLVQLSGSGTAQTCNTYAAGSVSAPSAIFIDSSTSNIGNVWVALNGSTTINRYNPTATTSLSFTAPAAVLAIAGDGNGNIFFSTSIGLYEIAGGASLTATATPTLVTNQVLGATSLMPDKTNTTLWAATGSGNLYQIANAATTPTVTLFTTSAAAQSVVTNAFDFVFVSALSPSNNVSYFTGSGTNYAIQSGWPTTASLAGINQPTAITVDGANNVWSANHSSNTGGLYSLSEVSVLAAPLSPDTAAGGFQKAATYLNASSNLAIDQSGNVWVVGGATSNNFVTEIVGAGVPIYQPYALGLHNGRFQGKP